MAAGWMFLALFSQCLWGSFPVVLRYLQIKETHQLTSLQLNFLLNAFPIPLLIIQGLFHWSHSVAYRRGRASALDRARETTRLLLRAWPDTTRRPLLAATEKAISFSEEEDDTSIWKKMGFLFLTTAAITVLALSQMFSLLYVEAYISQMVFLLAPLLVSWLALVLLRTPLPPKFWPTLLLMLAGSAMVVIGKAEATAPGGGGGGGGGGAASPTMAPGLDEEPWEPSGLEWLPDWWGLGMINWNDVIGIGLSFLSALALAVFMLTVQVAGHRITDGQIMGTNFPAQAALSFGLTYWLERPQLAVFSQLLPFEWAMLAGMSLCLNWLGSLLQQVTIKHLGAPQVAALLPVRLVGSMAGSYLVLGERLDDWVEGAGAGLVLATLTWFLAAQKRNAQRAALQRMLEEADGGLPLQRLLSDMADSETGWA